MASISFYHSTTRRATRRSACPPTLILTAWFCLDPLALPSENAKYHPAIVCNRSLQGVTGPLCLDKANYEHVSFTFANVAVVKTA